MRVGARIARSIVRTAAGRTPLLARTAPYSFTLTTTRFSSTDASKPGDEDVVVEPVTESTGATQAAPAEVPVGEAEESSFKAETRQLLDIVACSLYSDKEVFIRELVSNASDALEKRRHLELTDEHWKREPEDEVPAVHLTVNQGRSRFTIRDTGVGMTKEELAMNLGTIARSGSKNFVRELQEKGKSADTTDKIIGQFGVGFYSTFMVAKYVRVYSRSAKVGSKGYLWESDGTGKFKITECENVPKGTKIELDLKDTEISFCTPQVVERVVKKYSNFVEFEISLNGGRLNTVEALWMKSKDEVTNEEHIDFYKFISGAYDSPMLRLHYVVDAPISVRALLYIPQSHSEKYGAGRMESSINLYCRRVLIQSKAKNVLPDWLRFIKGAVDSESIPLNLSREHTQDGGMMRKLNTVLTKRILKWLDEESRKDRVKYEKFMQEFGSFLKEGVCTDQTNKMDIAKLLRFESTKCDPSCTHISLDEYVDRMAPNQTHIYFLSSPSKEVAMNSPYFEQYKEHDLEVLVLTEPIDDFVMQHLDTFRKHKLQNIETFDAATCGSVTSKKKLEGNQDVLLKSELSEEQCKELSDFITKRLVGRVSVVKATTRLRDSPAVLADHESAQMRKLYKITGQFQGPPPKYNLHFNPQHELIRKLYVMAKSSNTDEVETAGLISEQLFDNAVIAAGLLDDPRTILPRLNSMLTKMVKGVAEPPKGSQ